MTKKKTKKKRKMMKRGGFCLPCAAAAGPVGVGVAAVGTVGYYGYKKMNGGTRTGKFKKNECYFCLLKTSHERLAQGYVYIPSSTIFNS